MTGNAGRAWCFGDGVDTDVMLPGHALRLPLDEAARSAFEAVRPGWAATVQPGDVVIGGHDFGTGSARPAGAMLRLLGVRAVLAESMSSLFQRNAINAGLLALAVPGVATAFCDGERVELDDGRLRSLERDIVISWPEISPFLRRILDAGGLVEQLRRDGYLPPEPTPALVVGSALRTPGGGPT